MDRGVPVFPGTIRKNDAIFMYGAIRPRPFVFCYAQERTEVVHGPSCKKALEIHLDRCADDHVAVVERRGGGGTVVLAPGTVVTIVVGERRALDGARDVFRRIHKALIETLRDRGTGPIEQSGISDLSIGGRKVLGSSLYMGTQPRLYYYQSSLLVDTDTLLFEKYLQHPPREPDYRKGRSHAQFCTTLRSEGCELTPEEVAGVIREGLAGRL